MQVPEETTTEKGTSQHFLALVRRLKDSVNASVVLQWHGILVSAYSDPDRHYHTMDHIGMMLDLLDEDRENVRYADDVELAIWFHDAVYDPKRNDNESASKILFINFSRDIQLTGTATCRRVCTLIDATVSHEIPGELKSPEEIATAAFFLDCDLHILGTAQAVYDKYAKDIRREYAHFDDATFWQGRIAVLKKILSKEKVYFLSDRNDAAARENMLREIENHIR